MTRSEGFPPPWGPVDSAVTVAALNGISPGTVPDLNVNWRMRSRKDVEMATVMNPAEVQAHTNLSPLAQAKPQAQAHTQPRAQAHAAVATPATAKLDPVAPAPVGSIASLENRLGF